MNEGYVKLFRKSIDSRVFRNMGLWQLWTWCLMKASHKEIWVPVSTGRGDTEVKLLPGQFIFGRNAASKELKQKPFSTYKRMLKLENMQNLTIQSNTHFSLVTICNWEKYQTQENQEEQAKEQPRNNQGTTKEQPRNTNKNAKNVKNAKEEELGDNSNGKKTFLEYVKLTEEEHANLLKEFGNEQVIWMISELDNYIGAMPKKRNKYSDHNRVLRGWVLEKYQEKHPNRETEGGWQV